MGAAVVQLVQARNLAARAAIAVAIHAQPAITDLDRVKAAAEFAGGVSRRNAESRGGQWIGCVHEVGVFQSLPLAISQMIQPPWMIASTSKPMPEPRSTRNSVFSLKRP